MLCSLGPLSISPADWKAQPVSGCVSPMDWLGITFFIALSVWAPNAGLATCGIRTSALTAFFRCCMTVAMVSRAQRHQRHHELAWLHSGSLRWYASDLLAAWLRLLPESGTSVKIYPPMTIRWRGGSLRALGPPPLPLIGIWLSYGAIGGWHFRPTSSPSTAGPRHLMSRACLACFCLCIYGGGQHPTAGLSASARTLKLYANKNK